MDSLLRRKTLDFSIDEIYKREDNLYTVKIIPDIKSEYFPAYHLREINIDKYLLDSGCAKPVYSLRQIHIISPLYVITH